MSLAEIMPAVEGLSRSEKYELARLLIDGLAKEDLSPGFQEGHAYPIYTPEYAPGAASQLAQLLKNSQRQG
jgi:hypothetical protein